MEEKPKKTNEGYVFEFYDENYEESVEGEKAEIKWEYNKVNFKDDLNEEQLDIVNNIRGPMLVIAGAGSGKTRTIVYSVAKLLSTGVKPSQIMLVTFTNKAANEMIKRVENLLGKKPKGIWAGTFHALANRFLRKYAKTLGLKTNYTIIDETDANSLMKIAIDHANVLEIEERFPTASIAKDILSYSINCNKSVRDVILWKYNQFDSDKIISKLKELFKIYESRKAKDNLVDFDDLLVFWNKLLNEKTVAQHIARNIKYVLVDEYQDTNYIQDEIIFKIAKQNPQHNIMVVGDDAQSIYAFRGANFQNILNFSKKFENCKIYKITYNYRSVPEILTLANDSIKHNQQQFQKEMKTTRPNGLKPYQLNLGDDEEQARFISNQILKLQSEGYKLHEMAILVRAGSHTMKIELELQAKNIPYEVRAGVSFFEKAHIKDMLVHLNIIENPYDELSWSRVLTMIQGIGRASASKIYDAISKTDNPIASILDKELFSVRLKGAKIPKAGKKNLIAHIKHIADLTPKDNPSEVILRITTLIEDYIKSKYADWQDRIEDLKQLSIYAQNYATIQNFLEILSLNVNSIESRSVKAGSKYGDEKPIIISTIHRAKGLEWRVVFIPMLCEDFFPSSQVIGDEEAFEEERRVFYVAITRAKDQLYFISPALIRTYRGLQTARLSQFISELDDNNYQISSVKFKIRQEVYSKESNKTRAKQQKKKITAVFTTADELIKDKES